jgi:DNA invertase Pin-like site-specific DNA recombinase
MDDGVPISNRMITNLSSIRHAVGRNARGGGRPGTSRARGAHPGTICADIDRLAGEVDELRRTAEVLERCAGVSTDRVPLEERRRIVAELRAQGLSARRIAKAVGCHRVTVSLDLNALNVPRPETTLGIDGETRRHAPR